MIITIDGPAGAGKSTVAKRLAARLGFRFLDTGAMYRAVTWAALKCGADVCNHQAIAAIAANLEIEFAGEKVFVDGVDATVDIRDKEVTQSVSEIADNADVREHMVMLQREIASTGDFVCEGRDQGTVVFPNAECKIFLTASASERALRRFNEMQSTGAHVDFDSVLKQQENRDQRDLDRPVGQLRKADDAVEVITDGKSIDQVVDDIEEIARERISKTQP